MRRILPVYIFLSFCSWSLHAGEESIRLPDGSKIDILIEYPSSTNAQKANLCVVMGGGAGNKDQAVSAMNTMGKPLIERGMVAVSPVSPSGTSFFGPDAGKVLAMVKVLQKRSSNSSRVLIGGISNGGISALTIASMDPQRFSGVIMTPGLPSKLQKRTALKNMHIYMRIGAQDSLGWAEYYSRAVKELTALGAKLDAKLLEGTGHGFPLNWEELDAWMKQLP